MSWQLIIFVRLLIGNVFYTALLKHISDKKHKTLHQFWIYLFCLILALLYLLYKKHFVLHPQLIFIIGLGLLNSLAVYLNIRAISISLSKTSALTQLDDIISIGLGYIFLKELKFLNLSLALGVSCCFIAAIFFLRKNSQKDSQLSLKNSYRFILYITGFSLIWGLVGFSMRYFALDGISSASFLISWYIGAWLGSGILLLFKQYRKTSSLKPHLPIYKLALASVLMWTSFLLSFEAFARAPITIIQPLLLLGEIIFPVLVGLFWFKEIHKLNKNGYVGLFFGILGATILLLGF